MGTAVDSRSERARIRAMPSIVSSRELRAVKKLPFCYACGGELEFGAASDDHVPPKSCVAQLDRANSPLILPTHAVCNGSFSHSDERVGQFLSLLHGRRVASDKNLLKFSQVNADHMALSSVDLYGTIWRWLRAFHAALYWQPLDAASKYAIELPCNVLTPGPFGITLDAGRPRQRKLCQETLQ